MSNLKFSKQMSESIKLGVILAIAGGFMDAYSYMCRGKVFANAQTGNILLLGINISERNWHMALHYLVPVLAFAIGIALADLVKIRTKNLTLLHWRQISVFCEAVILLSVSFIPQDFNLVANALTSLACGIQVGKLPQNPWKRNCNHHVHRKLTKCDPAYVQLCEHEG